MYFKIKQKDLNNFSSFQHKKNSDGYSYEQDIYTLKKPLEIEIIGSSDKEYISFTEKVSEIKISEWLNSNLYGISFKLENNTQINLTHSKPNSYVLKIYDEEGLIQ